jgi:hypothetical protein
VIDAGRWDDDVRLSDLEARFTCQVCGHRGADIRPLFEHARHGNRLASPSVRSKLPGTKRRLTA